MPLEVMTWKPCVIVTPTQPPGGSGGTLIMACASIACAGLQKSKTGRRQQD